jgi:hypothetical protein
MTRKHFIEIAESFNADIRYQLGKGKPETALAIYYAATHLCPCFSASNPNFDEYRFKQALVVNIEIWITSAGIDRSSISETAADAIETFRCMSNGSCN